MKGCRVPTDYGITRMFYSNHEGTVRQGCRTPSDYGIISSMALKKKRKQPAWEKLDNTALLFPVIATEGMSNVYRLSACMTEEIDPEALAEAQEKVLSQFLGFRMRLRAGFFWYYFEENDRPLPEVREENDFPGAYINKSRNNQYLFRITYYRKRINLEVFHALTDGFGGLVLLKELVYQYLRIKHPEILEVEKDKISSGIFLDKEDSYLKNFKRAKGRDVAYKSKKAITLKGEKLPKGQLGVVHGILPFAQLKTAAKAHGITLNQYLVGTFVYAIYREVLKGDPSDVPINCCVPVDLRSYYDSHTMKNFFAMVSAIFKPEKDEYSYEEVLAIVAESLKSQTTPEHLNDILSYNVSNETNKFLRPIPLFIKNIAIKKVYDATAYGTTSTVTNVGRIELREPYRPYVENFYAMLSMSKGQNVKGAVLSYNDKMIITFTTILADLSVLRRFFKCLTADGVECAIETNGVWD